MSLPRPLVGHPPNPRDVPAAIGSRAEAQQLSARHHCWAVEAVDRGLPANAVYHQMWARHFHDDADPSFEASDSGERELWAKAIMLCQQHLKTAPLPCEHDDLDMGVCVDCGYDTAEDGPADDDWIHRAYEKQAENRPLTRTELIMMAVRD